jgi:cytoskeleton protein RodZ
MATLGERLRQEREAKGVSLEDIASQTRIGVRMLKAIEEEHFEQLPGGIYNKAFLRQYASFLGLDQEQVVREYDLATGAAQETSAPQPKFSPEAPTTRAPSFVLPWNLATLALIPIAAVTLWLVFRAPDSTEPASSQTNVALRRSSPEPARTSTGFAVPPREPSESSPSPVSSQPRAPGQETTFATAPSEPVLSPTPSMSENPLSVVTVEGPTFSDTGADELLLEISARSEVWLYITVDGSQIWQGILQPNQTRQVQAAESIRLTVGNAGGVELMLNGKPLGALGRPGEVKRVSIAGSALPSITP